MSPKTKTNKAGFLEFLNGFLDLFPSLEACKCKFGACSPQRKGLVRGAWVLDAKAKAPPRNQRTKSPGKMARVGRIELEKWFTVRQHWCPQNYLWLCSSRLVPLRITSNQFFVCRGTTTGAYPKGTKRILSRPIPWQPRFGPNHHRLPACC